MTSPGSEPSRGLRTLVVDDEKNIRLTLSVCLEQMGCAVTAVADGTAALAELARHPYDVAFLDLRLASANGLELIPRLLGVSPNLAIIIITAFATYETAVEAIRRGARSYLPKPFTPAQIRQVVEQVAQQRAVQAGALEPPLSDLAPDVDLATESPRMRALLEMVTRAAQADATVLLRGESGTGKGVLAQLLHARSARQRAPLVVVNCPTLTEDLLASELFGHARGAFTGAVRDQQGRVEAAQGGTLFLDEIAELPPSLQAKLLRFLQDRKFERLGENQTRSADVRVVAATNRNLEEDVKAGRFREDLWYRLNVLELTVPPLRERPEDILPLAQRFLAFFARAAHRPTPELSQETQAILRAHTWPGNIRELRNLVERVVVLWAPQVVEPAALPARLLPAVGTGVALGGDHSLEAVEREHITRVLARVRTQEEAARILGVDATTLWRKRKKYGES